MRRVEVGLLIAACAVSAFAQSGTAQIYDKADTFEPGKKYNCVPTADHKGWDCNEAGKAVEIKPKESEPRPAPSSPAAAESAPPTPPPPAPPSRSTLPSYLTNAATTRPSSVEEAPGTVAAAAAHANAPSPVPPPAARAETVAEKTPKPVAAMPTTPGAPPKSSAAPPPSKPAVPPRVTRPPVVEAASAGGDFMALPGDHFVIEMAHASSRSELDAVKSSTKIPNGDLYELHLRQNGADAWLLLWGSFDTVDAARAARSAISAAATPGWPRRIAPLQAEARRISP